MVDARRAQRRDDGPLASIGVPINGQVVEFYETDGFLIESVVGFVGSALRDRHAAMVIADPRHRRNLEAGLEAAGLDLSAATATGRYVVLDDMELLARFMIDGRPDAGRFRDTLGPIIERAHEAGGEVRIYSELVSRLYGQGNLDATIALGDLWLRLESAYDFTVLCAYPMRAFAGEGSAAMFDRICAQHSLVVPSDPYPLEGTSDEKERAVAALQREVVSLRATVARLRADQERLDELAHVDALTRLGNRRAFDRHLDREWQLAGRNGTDSVLVLCDIDRFKQFNDSHGHSAGDEILQTFARALRSAARSTDILCRIGGDEFAVILTDCVEPDVDVFAGRLRVAMAIAAPVGIEDVTVSVGHSSLLHATSPSDAYERADRTMYGDKRTPEPGDTSGGDLAVRDVRALVPETREA